MFARGLKSLTFACIFLHYFRSLIEGKVACNGHLELYYILLIEFDDNIHALPISCYKINKKNYEINKISNVI